MAKTIRSMSQDYLKSDECKRIMANNKRGEDADRANRVTVQNNNGKDIYVYEEGSRNGSRVNVNSSGCFDCKKGLYYIFNSNSSVNGGWLQDIFSEPKLWRHAQPIGWSLKLIQYHARCQF